MSTETKKEKKFPFKYIFAIEILILIAGIITAFYFIFSNIMGDLDQMWIGLYILWGSMGYVPVVIIPTVVLMVFKRRNSMFTSLKNFKDSKIGPYAPGYKSSGAKKPRFCEYCGYEVLTGERECTECGGPVKTINSSYI